MICYVLQCDDCSRVGFSSTRAKPKTVRAMRAELRERGWITAYRRGQRIDLCSSCAGKV